MLRLLHTQPAKPLTTTSMPPNPCITSGVQQNARGEREWTPELVEQGREILSDMRPLSRSYQTWRGLRHLPDDAVAGGVLALDGFVSTSTAPGWSWTFADRGGAERVVLRLRVPRGAIGTVENAGEAEVLLAPTKGRVRSVTDLGDGVTLVEVDVMTGFEPPAELLEGPG